MVTAHKISLGKLVSECGNGCEGSVKVAGSAALVLKPAILGASGCFSLVLNDGMLVRGNLYGLLYAEKVLNTLGKLIERKLVASAKREKR